jgi:hypothetical protein
VDGNDTNNKEKGFGKIILKAYDKKENSLYKNKITAAM